MMRFWRRSCSKVFCAVLILVAANILLVFYTVGTIHHLIVESLHKEGPAVVQRPLHLEKNVHHSSKFHPTGRGNLRVCRLKEL